MTTNDQPSPTDPTQTPPSEPEYSTGPEQLEWEYRGDPYSRLGGTWHATTTHGAYLISREMPAPRDVWGVLYGRAPHTAAAPNAPTIESPGPLDEVKSAVERHHRATLRRLAWEQYMRDNDPPTGSAINYLINQCDQAQTSVNIARQILGLP
ncbi:hypothetical protein [Mycobacteroides abscessus]|uniref:hypothetical protein n=1 Tax=Mycobacteroides abscessus TaxID=36809 RepID=UPI00092C37C7|nr:hypothetical protein [Mycobacteroides abscessus]MDO3327496.1 hypothetical protein [Mycobacteroides abscessus subsp. abscessus]SHT37051.1 Uncharacterised protein [Mycobacteroides abscessus subsp. abscessus]SHU45954.1 Uncharacterised protein [Mycobacteroides abscessus subsp. abscessus]SIK01795.1 Uncharacterised protein [Mycobacteroides abscessus subsp. abscessus]